MLSLKRSLSRCVAIATLASALPLMAAISWPGDILLSDNWRIQSTEQCQKSGAEISSPAFDVSTWRAASAPSTVLAALVNDGVYTNIFFGTNLAKISPEPFARPWWFRDEFYLTESQAHENASLVFEGINYRANIWLNGQKIAAAQDTFGSFRTFHFDVAGKLKPGPNIVAAEISPPQPGDYTMGFVDWNPKAPDKEMGLFRPVKLHLNKAVGLDHVFVETRLDHANWRDAQLTIRADLTNQTDHDVKVKIFGAIARGALGDLPFQANCPLQAHEGRTITLTPEQIPQLNFHNAQLWWPWELGEPHLYTLRLTAQADGETSDEREVRFGIREVSDYFTPEGYRGYTINGKRILIRGGGWADELLLRESRTNLEAQLQYVKAMNLNAIRLEGVWGESQQLYDLADEYGLFVMPGWSCQWEWEDGLGKKTDDFGAFQTAPEMELVTNYLHDQVLWLRNHPSIFVWVLGSDKHPRPELETRYDALLPAIDPTRPALMSCAGIKSSVSGPSAVKMNGPYDYVTPNYWYLDRKNGGAFGYNTETGPGPQPPPLDSLRRMIPPEDLWPVDKTWNYHCARGQFKDMKRYLDAFNHRYGPASSVEEFAFKTQAANYEALRAMYEAFAVNLPHTTGIIQWMLNPSWPKLYWQLYDYYLVPGGAFFGVKHGAATIAVIYNYGDQGIYLVNQTARDLADCHTKITVYDLNSRLILDQTVATADASYGSHKIFDLSTLHPSTPVYFVALQTTDDTASQALADNFYWLSTKPDVLDESKSTWYVTPDKSFADFTALNQLPKASCQARVKFATAANETTAEVTLANPTDTLAFFIEMRLADRASGHTVTPVLWDDNYVSLLPHTTRVFHARLAAGPTPDLELQGWNVAFEHVTIE